MPGSFRTKIGWACCALLLSLLTAAPAQSRIWSHNPSTLAQDYLVISDNRGGGELVMLMWLAPQMVQNPQTHRSFADLLGKYVIIGVVHAHMSNEGTATFEPIETLDASDSAGKPLQLLHEDTMPPAVVGTIATMQTAFARALGAVGKGMHWFVFESGSVQSCTKGGLAVQYADEKYTYDTPIPGCS